MQSSITSLLRKKNKLIWHHVRKYNNHNYNYQYYNDTNTSKSLLSKTRQIKTTTTTMPSSTTMSFLMRRHSYSHDAHVSHSQSQSQSGSNSGANGDGANGGGYRRYLPPLPTKWVIGLLLATPTIALLQGAVLLYDFRKDHGHAPVPVSPSRGIVVMKNNQHNQNHQNNNHSSNDETVSNGVTSSSSSSSSSSFYRKLLPSSLLSTNKSQQVQQQQQQHHHHHPKDNYQSKPLRLLVIGDSLAAGVGVSTQGTPILPESIAKSLSQASGGRAVSWTCVGNPGASSSQIVHDIISYHQGTEAADNDDESTNMLELKLAEWQATKRRAQAWLDQRKKRREQNKMEDDMNDDNDDNEDDYTDEYERLEHAKYNDTVDDNHVVDNDANNNHDENPTNRVKKWWRRLRRDLKSFRKQVLLVPKEAEDTDVTIILHERRLARRLSLSHPKKDANSKSSTNDNNDSDTDDDDKEEYDIAVVMTGLNDLKDMWLPFMTYGKNAATSKEAQQHASKDGIQGELLRVLRALKDKMKIQLHNDEDDDKITTNRDETDDNTKANARSTHDANVDNEKRSKGEDDTTFSSTTTNNNSDDDGCGGGHRDGPGPLVVFPSLPTAPLPFCHRAPLSWFVVPLLTMMDEHKKKLADQYPNFVLFVAAPTTDALKDMEAGRGPIFDSIKAEQVLLLMTDVKDAVKEKVETLMKEHYYKRWKRVGTESNDCKESHVDVTETTTANSDASSPPSLSSSSSVPKTRPQQAQAQYQKHDAQQQFQKDKAREERTMTRDVYHGGCHDHLLSSEHDTHRPGSSLIAMDNVHPNDEGYDFWGRHIAAAILQEWDKQQQQQQQS